MKNRTSLSSAILLLLVAVAFMLPFLSWGFTAFGFECNSLLSDEGVRWLFVHLTDAMFSHHSILCLQILVAYGVVKQCGLIDDFAHIQRWPLFIAVITALLQVFLIAAGAMLPHSPLLNITGTLSPSAWLYGLPTALLFAMQSSAMVYGLLSRRIHSVMNISQALTWGVSHHPSIIIMLMLVNFIYESMMFIFKY